MEKLLTLVIPTYNMEKYLQRCLDSLLISDQQVFHKLEVLIVNDGSKDASSAIGHQYESKFPEVFRVIDKENGNYGSCINRGVDESTGLFFKILDADDWYSTDGLASLLQEIDKWKDGVDALFTEFTYHDFYNNTKTLYQFKEVDYQHAFYLKDIPMVGTANEFMLKMYSLTIKTDILRKIGLRLDTGISYTDNEFMYFPYHQIGKAVFLQVNVYQYFIGRDDQTVSLANSMRHINDVYIIAQRLLEDYKQIKDIDMSEHVRNVKEYFVVKCCMGYVNHILAHDPQEETKAKMIQLFNGLKENPVLLRKAHRKSPYFWMWEKTGIYKSNKWFRPIYKIIKAIKG